MGMRLFYVTVLVIFFVRGDGAGAGVFTGFLRGVAGKAAFSCGVFVVTLWWIAWFPWKDYTTLRGG
jgi:hypothetical protein